MREWASGETDRIRWRNNPRNHQRAPTTPTARRWHSLFSDVIWMASAFWASRQRNKLLALGRRARRGRRGHGLYADQAQFLEPPVLQCADQQGHARFPDAARRLRRNRRHIARPQRRADVAQSELEGRPAPRPGERSPERVAQAQARFPPVEFGPARRQPRPAPPGRRPASDRSLDRPRHWPSAVEPSSAHICRRALGAVARPVSAVRWPRLRSARLSRVVRAALRRRRVVSELARRPPADQSQCRALCARGGFSLRPRAGKRAYRRHHPLRRRSRREGRA